MLDQPNYVLIGGTWRAVRKRLSGGPGPSASAFDPTSLTFDSPSYTAGATATMTITGTPASDGSIPTAVATDSSGISWVKVGTSTTTQITMRATVSASAGSKTVSVVTSPGGGTISGNYTVTVVAPPSGWDVRTSMVWGAGYQTNGDISPFDPNLQLLGGDICGIHATSDGRMWTTCNMNLDDENYMHVVAARWSRVEATKYTCYAYCIQFQRGGGNKSYIYKGAYNTTTKYIEWGPVGTGMPPVVMGIWASATNGAMPGDTVPTGTSGHPRQTKWNMMALDEPVNFMYVGSIDGVWRISLVNRSVTRIALPGSSVTALALDPTDATIIYATCDQGPAKGVSKITNIRAAGTNAAPATTYSTNMPYPQSVRAGVNGTGDVCLWVTTGKILSVGNTSWGIAFHDTATFTTGWKDVTNNWAADLTGAGEVMIVGLDAVWKTGKWYAIAAHCWDMNSAPANARVGETEWTGTGVPSWVKVTASRANDVMPNGDHWFLIADPGPHAGFSMWKGEFDSNSPIISEMNPAIRMAPGRGGNWGVNPAINGGKWFPHIMGTSATTAQDIAISHSNKDLIIAGDVDWGVLRMSDGSISEQPKGIKPQGGNGHSVINTGGNEILLAMGDRDKNQGGGIFTSPNPWATPDGNWTNQMMSGTGRPWANNNDIGRTTSGAKGVDSTGKTIILAPVSKGAESDVSAKTGMWRKVIPAGAPSTSGVWSKVTFAGMADPFQDIEFKTRLHMAWRPGSQTVWLCTKGVQGRTTDAKGIYRSTDAGLTWDLIWEDLITSSEPEPPSKAGGTSGHIKYDESRPNVGYVCSGGKAYRINNFDTGAPTRTIINTANGMAQLVVSDPATGWLYSIGDKASGLWVSKTATATSEGTWENKTTPSWKSTMVMPNGADVYQGRLVLASMNGYFVIG